MKFTKMPPEDALVFSTYVASGTCDGQRFTIATTGTKLIVNFAGEHYSLTFDDLMRDIAQDRRDALKLAKEEKAVRKQEAHF